MQHSVPGCTKLCCVGPRTLKDGDMGRSSVSRCQFTPRVRLHQTPPTTQAKYYYLVLISIYISAACPFYIESRLLHTTDLVGHLPQQKVSNIALPRMQRVELGKLAALAVRFIPR